MALTRREFMSRVAALGALASTLPMLGCGAPGAADGFPVYTWEGPLGPETAFQHGVASADPLVDSVLLWTRVSPPEGETGDIDVFVEVSKSPDFAERVAVGTFTAKAAADWTLTLDQTELEPGTTYHYRFSALGRTSEVGRTRTAPAGATERFRVAVGSCSNFAFGHMHAYRHIADRTDLDAFIHLGDYIYEYATDGIGASFGLYLPVDPPHECLTLDDYRRRYAHYRTSPDLRAAHGAHPVLAIWDDHEFANNPKLDGAGNHTEGDEGAWTDRVAAALQAHTEWLPTRMREGGRIFRDLAFGDLAHVVLVDRQRRFLWPEADDGDTYLGAEQTAWVKDRISAVTAQWLVLCTATSFTSRKANGSDGGSFDGSAWDGASRREVLDAVAEAGIENLVVVVGDIHRGEALDVAHDPSSYDPATGSGSEGVEFACGSISSPGATAPTADVPQFFWSDGTRRGYLFLDISPAELRAEFWGYEDDAKLDVATPQEQLLKAFTAAAGSHHLVEV